MRQISSQINPSFLFPTFPIMATAVAQPTAGIEPFQSSFLNRIADLNAQLYEATPETLTSHLDTVLEMSKVRLSLRGPAAFSMLPFYAPPNPTYSVPMYLRDPAFSFKEEGCLDGSKLKTPLVPLRLTKCFCFNLWCRRRHCRSCLTFWACRPPP